MDCAARPWTIWAIGAAFCRGSGADDGDIAQLAGQERDGVRRLLTRIAVPWISSASTNAA